MYSQNLPSSAESYAAAQRLEMNRAMVAVKRQWHRMGPEFDSSYLMLEPTLLAVVRTAQERLAVGAAAYIPTVLDEQGITAAPFARVSSSPLIGVAGDGRPVDSLLYGAIAGAKTAVGNGSTSFAALRSSGQWLTSTVGTLLSDTARQSEALHSGVRPVTGYVRMLNAPSCSRCVVLAGKFYRKNAGFARHPRCFPAGVVVNGPASEAATRRWYKGELVVLTTASGQELPLTGNHPVLTSRGWVPANLIEEGDEVVRSTRPEGATPLVIPDHHQVPSRIEDVWGALSMSGLDTVESSPEDFHGDGQHGNVDVVRANGSLDGRALAALAKHGEQVNLSVAPRTPPLLAQQGGAVLFDLRVAASAHRLMGGSDLRLALSVAHLAHANEASLTGSSALDASASESLRDDSARDAVLTGEGILARSAKVGGDDLFSGDDLELSRWDAPGDALTVETAGGYTARGRDLLNRLSGQVELDRVVQLRRVEWSGHVYSLTSSEGWHVANSLIVSNCDCRHIPSTEALAGDMTVDPVAYFDSLTKAEQDKTFGAAGAEALRADANMSQVVNARRGVRTSQVGGRSILTTTEGTTRRGIAYREMGASRATSAKVAGQRYARTVRPRLMPETCLQVSTDRADYLRRLAANGYFA